MDIFPLFLLGMRENPDFIDYDTPLVWSRKKIHSSSSKAEFPLFILIPFIEVLHRQLQSVNSEELSSLPKSWGRKFQKTTPRPGFPDFGNIRDLPLAPGHGMRPFQRKFGILALGMSSSSPKQSLFSAQCWDFLRWRQRKGNKPFQSLWKCLWNSPAPQTSHSWCHSVKIPGKPQPDSTLQDSSSIPRFQLRNPAPNSGIWTRIPLRKSLPQIPNPAPGFQLWGKEFCNFQQFLVFLQLVGRKEGKQNFVPHNFLFSSFKSSPGLGSWREGVESFFSGPTDLHPNPQERENTGIINVTTSINWLIKCVAQLPLSSMCVFPLFPKFLKNLVFHHPDHSWGGISRPSPRYFQRFKTPKGFYGFYP